MNKQIEIPDTVDGVVGELQRLNAEKCGLQQRLREISDETAALIAGATAKYKVSPEQLIGLSSGSDVSQVDIADPSVPLPSHFPKQGPGAALRYTSDNVLVVDKAFLDRFDVLRGGESIARGVDNLFLMGSDMAKIARRVFLKTLAKNLGRFCTSDEIDAELRRNSSYDENLRSAVTLFDSAQTSASRLWDFFRLEKIYVYSEDKITHKLCAYRMIPRSFCEMDFEAVSNVLGVTKLGKSRHPSLIVKPEFLSCFKGFESADVETAIAFAKNRLFRPRSERFNLSVLKLAENAGKYILGHDNDVLIVDASCLRCAPQLESSDYCLDTAYVDNDYFPRDIRRSYSGNFTPAYGLMKRYN